MKKISSATAYLIACMMTVLMLGTIQLVACGGSQTGQKATVGGVAAGMCAIGDLFKYAGEVESLLATEGFDKALSDVAKKYNLTQDAINCVVQGVLAVLTSSQGSGAATGQESPVVVHARAYLKAHGAGK